MVMRTLCALCLALFISGSASAFVSPKPKPTTTKRQAGKTSLLGSKAVARQQNTEADRERLTRIANDKQLRRFIKAGILVSLPDNLFVKVDSRLEPRYRYCRPWTRDFLNDYGQAHFLATHGEPIKINSAVRPKSRQEALRRTNRNAAPIVGPYRSSHLTASTVDIAKGKNTEWSRDYLQLKKSQRQIAVVEEFRQPVFHVMVFKDYGKKKLAATAQKSAKKVPSRRKSS
jgi:hypothetical protein